MRRSISFFGGESRLIEEQRRRKEKKTVMLLVWVVIVFILAWLPLNSLSVLLDLNLYKTIFRYFEMFNVCEVHIKVNTGTWKTNWIMLWLCVSSAVYPNGDDSLFRACFCLCHITSLLSALANPILYGYFNEVCVNLKYSGCCKALILRGSDGNFVSWSTKDVVEYRNKKLVKDLVILMNVSHLEMSEMPKSCDMCSTKTIL